MAQDSIKIVARIIATADCVDRVRSILLAVVEPTRKETGCISYALLQNRTDPADFTFVEEWVSDAAIDAHLKREHITRALTELAGLLSVPPDIRRYNSAVSS
jgi:quinol monooxygenase YgiN